MVKRNTINRVLDVVLGAARMQCWFLVEIAFPMTCKGTVFRKQTLTPPTKPMPPSRLRLPPFACSHISVERKVVSAIEEVPALRRCGRLDLGDSGTVRNGDV